MICARYPHIDFGMPEIYVKTQIENLNAPKSYTEITAHMAQLTDQWLQKNPEKQGYLASIQFNTHANAEAIAGQLHEIGEESSLFLPSKVRGYGDRGVILLGERILDTQILQVVEGIRDLESPLEVLDHEVEHETRHLIERREGSTSAWEGVEQGTLNAFYQQTQIEQSKRLYADEGFKKLLGEIDELRRKNSVLIPTYEPTLAPNVPEEEQRIPIMGRTLFYADAIQKTEEQLMRLKNDDTLIDEDKARAAELHRRFNEVIKERTGLYPYSFKGGTYEFSATYGELSPVQARKCLDCAQLEFDQVMSLDPSSALRKKAEGRYYKIMGSACKTRQCGPCTIYKKTCNPNAGQS